MPRSFPIRPLVGGTLLLCIPGLLFAAAEPEELDEVVVTARKRPELVWNIPFSVDVQTNAQLQSRRATDGERALRDVGGAGMTVFGDRSNSFIVMRGMGPVLTPLSLDDSSVLTFVDGAPLSIGASNSAYLDLARVEVLKGPQSALFGRNTSGGAVNLIPELPTFMPSARVSGEYGRAGSYQVETVLDGPLAGDKLAGRVAFRRSGADGYVDNTAGPRLGEEDTTVGRASLLYTPGERTRLLLTGGLEDTDLTAIYYLLSPGPRVAAQNLAHDNLRVGNYGAKLEHELDRTQFVSQTSYSTYKANDGYNYPDFRLASEMFGLPQEYFSDPATNHNSYLRKEKRFTQEFRLSSLPAAGATWMMGAVYYHDEFDFMQDVNLLNNAAYGGGKHYHLDTDGYAVFGDVAAPVSDRVTVSASARLAREDKEFDGEYFGNDMEGALPYFPEEGSKDYEFWAGRLGATFSWSEKVMSFASVSRGYKTGGFGLYNSLAFIGVPRTPYGSAKVTTLELGSRLALLDRRLRVDAAVFLNEAKDEQILTWSYTTFVAEALNIDNRSGGVELSASFRPDEHWEINGGTAWTRARLRNVSDRVAELQPGVENGDRPPNVAEWTARVELLYRAALPWSGVAGASFTGRLGYNYIGKRYTDAANDGPLDPVDLISARLGLAWKNADAYVYGENLLGRRYKVVNQPWGISANSGEPIFGASYARGAVVGVGASWRF